MVPMTTSLHEPLPAWAAPTTLAARAEAATKVYGSGDTEVRALDGVSVEFPAGRFTAIMGPSGSGKSTLMHCLAGLDTLTSGHVYLGDVDLGSLSDKELTIMRRDRIGFVFQSFNLIPTLTAQENITLPIDLAGRQGRQRVVRRRDRHGRAAQPPAATGRPSSPAASSSASRSPGRSPAVPR